MKKFISITLLAGLLLSATAQADVLNLRASNGIGIRVYYGMHSGTTGESSWDYATGVHVEVDHGLPGVTRVVLVESCREFFYPTERNYQFTFDCDYKHDGSWIPHQCVVRGDAGFYYERFGGTVPLERANHSGSLRCRPELAIELRPGQWLTDPVNGSHNFGLSFPVGRY